MGNTSAVSLDQKVKMSPLSNRSVGSLAFHLSWRVRNKFTHPFMTGSRKPCTAELIDAKRMFSSPFTERTLFSLFLGPTAIVTDSGVAENNKTIAKNKHV